VLGAKIHCGPCPSALLSRDRYRNGSHHLDKRALQRWATTLATPRTQILKRRSSRVALNTPATTLQSVRPPFSASLRLLTAERCMFASYRHPGPAFMVLHNPRGPIPRTSPCDCEASYMLDRRPAGLFHEGFFLRQLSKMTVAHFHRRTYD
jgi:hypothetical protein